MRDRSFMQFVGYLIVLVIYPIIVITGPLVIFDELYACWRMSSTATGRISDHAINIQDRDEKEPLYEATLVYAYDEQGKTYHNSRYGASWYTLGREYGPLFSALWTRLSYPLGTTVTVHFDPDDPQRSCLHRGVSTWAVGLTLLSTGVLLLFLQKRFPRFSSLEKQGYATSGVFGGLLLLLIGPRTMTLTWFIVIAVLFFFFLTNPGWRLFCRIIGRKPAPPLMTSPLEQPLSEQEKATLFQESYPKS